MSWSILICSEDLSDKQKKLLKEYLARKKIKHYAISTRTLLTGDFSKGEI